MKLMTEKEMELTIKNIVSACKNVEKLNNRGYSFLYLCSGFIAHYNLTGFKYYYSNESLTTHLLRNKDQNQWTNFRTGESDFDYYMQKKEIYNKVCAQLKG